LASAGLRPGQFAAAFGGGESIGINAEMQFGCKHEAAALLNGKQHFVSVGLKLFCIGFPVKFGTKFVARELPDSGASIFACHDSSAIPLPVAVR
jgi:hypothetical protein